MKIKILANTYKSAVWSKIPLAQHQLESRSSLFLTVKDTVRIVNRLDAPVALRRPDHGS